MDRPLELTVFFDYHCPYSYRAVKWIERLGPAHVGPRYRFFPLEQVNRDPDAAAWRLWEQPLDYEHYRGRQTRRPLAAFLVTALLDARETAAVTSAFRLAVYRARFDGRANITDLGLLEELARGAGANAERVSADLADPDRLADARERIRDDREAARAEYAIFGVPTLLLPGDPRSTCGSRRTCRPARRPGCWTRSSRSDLLRRACWSSRSPSSRPAPDGPTGS